MVGAQYYEFAHGLGLHMYTIPCLILIAAIVVIGLVHWRKIRKISQGEQEEDGEQAAGGTAENS